VSCALLVKGGQKGDRIEALLIIRSRVIGRVRIDGTQHDFVESIARHDLLKHMDIALIVAKLLGTYLVVSGLFLVIRGKTVPHLLNDFFDHPATLYLAGIILVCLSSLLLIENNIWDGTWRTLITVFAWLILLKGLAYIFFPDELNKTISKNTGSSYSAFGPIAIIIGLYLFFLG
jgi:hypothetical protein